MVASPNVGAGNTLTGVAAVSATDVWAVGYYGTVSTPDQTLIEHWNGSVWNVVTSPNVGTHTNVLNGVAAISANDVWAAGFYNPTATPDQTLIEHWNGTDWTVVSNTNVGTNVNSLSGVAAVSANDVWAVGDYGTDTITETLVEHWNGSAWSVVPGPDPGPGVSLRFLYGVAAVSANDVWAVGHYHNGSANQTLVEHWNGSVWSVVPSPNLGAYTNVLNGVAGVSATDVWAVGDYENGSAQQTLVERYNPCTVTCTIEFNDVPNSSAYYPYIHCLACRGIVSGYADGTFKPNNNVTRGQLSKIVSNSAGFSEPHSMQDFQDVPVGHPFYIWIERLYARGILGGYPCGGAFEPCGPGNLPYFRPGANATRGQITRIDANAAGYNDPPVGQQFEDVPPGQAFYTYTYQLATRGIMAGYNCGGPGEPCGPSNLPYYRPNNNATRGQTSKIVANTFFPHCQTPPR